MHEMNGHKFVQRQFYQLMLCAFCNDFLLNALGYQCEDCRYTCHKKCYEKVVTKCISKSNTGVSPRQTLTCNPFHRCVRRMVTKRRLTIVSHIDLNLLPTWGRIGVVTAVTCFPSVERTRANAQSAISPAMLTVLISSPISAVCLWRLPINSFANGVTSTRTRPALVN